MNKMKMITDLKNEADITKSEAAAVVQLFFNAVGDALVKEERVEIRGFCSLYVKYYRSYTGRNPKTGEKVQIKPKKLPFFKCGKEIRNRINKNL